MDIQGCRSAFNGIILIVGMAEVFYGDIFKIPVASQDKEYEIREFEKSVTLDETVYIISIEDSNVKYIFSDIRKSLKMIWTMLNRLYRLTERTMRSGRDKKRDKKFWRIMAGTFETSVKRISWSSRNKWQKVTVNVSEYGTVPIIQCLVTGTKTFTVRYFQSMWR